MTNTAAVKISDAEIRRQAAGQVRDLRALGNHGLYFRFHRSRERGSWYLIHKGKWNLIGSYPELSAAKVAAACRISVCAWRRVRGRACRAGC